MSTFVKHYQHYLGARPLQWLGTWPIKLLGIRAWTALNNLVRARILLCYATGARL